MIWLFFVFFIPFVLAGEQRQAIQPERILDVRQMIRDALDMMRQYPAPTQLMQQTVQQTQPQQSTANYYAQQQQSYYPPRTYGTTTYNGGAVSQVDRRFGSKADSQPDYAVQMSKWFAKPTQEDMEKLFHLPADILRQLAKDGGYIQPDESTTSESPSYTSSAQSFNFNIENSGGNSQDLNSFIASVQNPKTEAPVVNVLGPPSITTRQVLRDGKYVSIPILIIPQKGGENIYVPFSDMKQLSDAVNKIISTGHFQLTTPKDPDDFPKPSGNIQIEPPKQKAPKKSSDNKSSFVQSSNEEEVKTTTSKPKTTISTTKATISPAKIANRKSAKTNDEIVLNGQRYKLVAVESSAEEETKSTKAPVVIKHESEEKKEAKSPRQYSLKELEEMYNRENALAIRGTDLDDSESVIDQERQRIANLRQKFARDRLEVAQHTQKTFSKIEESQESNENKCHFLKSFAKKYGIGDMKLFAKSNCQYIESSFPNLRCDQIEEFITECHI